MEMADKRFDSPWEQDEVRPSQTRKAVQDKHDPSRAGRFRRTTVTLPDQQVEYLDQIADEHNLSRLGLIRWLIDIALQAYDDGARPEVIRQITSREAKKEHWSSEVG